MVVGDFNDQPHDRSVVGHLLASHELDRVVGETNDIDNFSAQTATYRAKEAFAYNPMWQFLPTEQSGTYFIDSTPDERFPNRYQVLDQIVVTRGLLSNQGLRLRLDSVAICRDRKVATPAGPPRKFDIKTRRGTSDHLPVTTVLDYD